MAAPLVMQFPQPTITDDDSPDLTIIELLGENARLLGTSKASFDLQEYYGRNSYVSSQIKFYSMTRGALIWMSLLSPVIYTNAVKMFTVYMEFDQAWAGNTPPGAPSRMVTFKETMRKFGLGRKGLGVQVPAGWHLSKRGQMIWQMQILQVATGMDDSLLLQTIEAILNTKSHLETLAETHGINYTEEQYLTDKAQGYAFFQKAKGGYQNFIPYAKKIIRLQDGDFDAVITNEEEHNFLGLIPAKSADNMARAESNAAELLLTSSVMKLGIVDALIFPPIYIDNNVAVDLLKRRDQVGAYNLMYDRNFGVSGYVYDTRHMSIQVFDEGKNSMETLTLPTAIKESGIGHEHWKKHLAGVSNSEVEDGLNILKRQTFDELLQTYVRIGGNIGLSYGDEYRRYLSEQMLARHLGQDWKKKSGALRSAFRNGLHSIPRTFAAKSEETVIERFQDLDEILNELSELHAELIAKMIESDKPSLTFTFYDLVLAFVDKANLDLALGPLIELSSTKLAGKTLNQLRAGLETEINTSALLLPALPRFYHELAVGAIQRSLIDGNGKAVAKIVKGSLATKSIYQYPDVNGAVYNFQEYIARALKLIENDRDTLLSFARDHQPIPYAFITSRENIETEGNATICIAKNEKTIKRYKGDELFTIGQDAVQQGIVGHLTAWCGTDVHTPKNLLIVDSTHVSRYLRGNGAIPFEFDKAVEGRGVRGYYDPKSNIYGEDNECSIKFLAIAPWEVPTLPNPLSVTGNFDDALRGLNLQKTRNKSHYSTAGAYNLIWQWPVNSGIKIPAVERIEQAPINYVNWLGFTKYFRPNNTNANGAFDDIQPETGPYVGITHENCAQYRSGTVAHTSDMVKTRTVRD